MKDSPQKAARKRKLPTERKRHGWGTAWVEGESRSETKKKSKGRKKA